ncbi:MAG TPA: ABC transporter permease [Acidimicrobiales bacterium]|jgi:ABC-2 type transport system permease protein|nr:ABC transporter permease [Acidimicrobiales bacterium]
MVSRIETPSATGVDQAAVAPVQAALPVEELPVRVVSAKISVTERLRLLWAYRNLFVGLVRKELKVRYKNSFLGFLWSLLNPALVLLIYFFVFQLVLGSGIPDFAIFLMAGLLAYNLFNYATMNATNTMVANSGIVKKVAFPREILALATVGAGVVFFFLQALVLVIALLAFRYQPAWSYLWLVAPALLALVLLVAALAVFLAAVNVYLRDTQHLVEIIVGTAWFWATPIVYSYEQIVGHFSQHGIPSWLPLLNPLADIVLAFQRGIYGKVNGGNAARAAHSLKPGAAFQAGTKILPAFGQWWYLWHVLIVAGLGIGLLVAALAVFGRLEGNFAEEL